MSDNADSKKLVGLFAFPGCSPASIRNLETSVAGCFALKEGLSR
jgi:hypothetical protein